LPLLVYPSIVVAFSDLRVILVVAAAVVVSPLLHYVQHLPRVVVAATFAAA